MVEKKYSNFIYLKSHNFVFAFIPKVACTNWKCIFRYMMGETDYLNARKAHDNKINGITFMSDVENNDQIIEDDHIKKYCFVRNPYSRALSAYLDKIKPFSIAHAPKERARHFYRMFEEIDQFRVLNLPGEENVNLFVFLSWILLSGHKHASNSHWIPQTRILYLDEIHYEFIGRFENLEKDAKCLLEMIGCDLNFPSHTEIRFASTGATKQLHKFYSQREVQLVQNIYAKDFELLNYPFTLPVWGL